MTISDQYTENLPEPANPPQRIHVIKKGKGWAIRKAGSERAMRVCDAKNITVKEAKIYLKKGYDIIIHQENGRVEKVIKPLPPPKNTPKSLPLRAAR